MVEYEITYSILADGIEIGFGTSGECDSTDQALGLIETAISRGEWESEKAITAAPQIGLETDGNGRSGDDQ